jgi:hypothetical protein
MPMTTDTNRLLLEQVALGPRTFSQLIQYFARAYPITPYSIQSALKRQRNAQNILSVQRRRYRGNGLPSGCYVEYTITERGRAILLAERLFAGQAVTVRCDCCGKVVQIG